MWTKDGGKRLIRLQVHPYRDSLTGVITPVRRKLQVLALQAFSHCLCGQLHVIYPGRYSCGSVSVSLYL
jgi:hypothetical protein